MATITHYSGRLANRSALSVVSVDDLRQCRTHPGNFDPERLSKIVPYCFDMSSGCLIAATDIDPLAAAAAPFHYQYLRQHAGEFVALNWQQLQILSREPICAESTVIFSPGRCGSTLLANILAANKIVTVSEPDFITQMVPLLKQALTNNQPTLARMLHLVRLALRLLLKPILNEPSLYALKMRSHANRAPLLLLQAFDKPPKPIFINRDFASWSRSRARAFNSTLQASLNSYWLAQQAQKKLSSCGPLLDLDYAQLTASPAKVSEQIAAYLGQPLQLSATVGATAIDSQRGTPLAREHIASKPHNLPDEATLTQLWQYYARRRPV